MVAKGYRSTVYRRTRPDAGPVPACCAGSRHRHRREAGHPRHWPTGSGGRHWHRHFARSARHWPTGSGSRHRHRHGARNPRHSHAVDSCAPPTSGPRFGRVSTCPGAACRSCPVSGVRQSIAGRVHVSRRCMSCMSGVRCPAVHRRPCPRVQGRPVHVSGVRCPGASAVTAGTGPASGLRSGCQTGRTHRAMLDGPAAETWTDHAGGNRCNWCLRPLRRRRRRPG
jgi:hypothetical protein